MKENVSVLVATNSILGALVFSMVASGCAAKASHPEVGDSDQYDREVVACIENLRQEVRVPFASAPDFSTLHEVTAWVSTRLPQEIRRSLIEAGRSVSQRKQNVARRDQLGYFSDIPSLNASMFGASVERLDKVSLCPLSGGAGGVAREVLLDQFNVGLNIEGKSVFNRLKQLGVDDSHFAGQLILYGVIFDLGGVQWTDEQIAELVKYMPMQQQ